MPKEEELLFFCSGDVFSDVLLGQGERRGCEDNHRVRRSGALLRSG